MRTSSCLLALAAMQILVAPVCAVAQSAQPSVLSLDEALARALAEAPELTAADARIEASDQRIAGAARRPNPTLDFTSESVLGTGDRNLLNEGEAAVGIMQPWERGGDREARSVLAERERDLRIAEAEIARRDLMQQVELAYLDAQAERVRHSIAEDRIISLEALAAIVDRRVQAARDPRMARDRIEARLAEARIEAGLAQRKVTSSATVLASYWSGLPDFSVDMQSFLSPDDLGANSADQNTPEIALLRAQRARSDAEIGLETARSVPDANVGLELRHFQSSNDVALGVRFSIPLQVWNANQANIASARSEAAAIDADLAARERVVLRQLQTLILRRQAAAGELAALEETVIPPLETALEQAETGFARGSFSFLEIYDVQQALINARLRSVDALYAIHQADIQLRRLTGAHDNMPQRMGVQ